MSIDLIEENGFTLKKTRGRWYPAETMADANYTDDLAFLANTPVQAESQLHSLKKATEAIGLYMNGNKRFYVLIKKKTISTWNGLCSNVSFTETNANIGQEKAWTTFNRLSIKWKSHLSDKIKQEFFLSCGFVNTIVCMHHMNGNKMHGEKARWELYKNVMCCFEQILKVTKQQLNSHLTSYLTNYTS